MGFFSSGVDSLQKVVYLIGGGLGLWGVINLLEGYGNDNPGAKSQGMKQFMAGAGIVVLGLTLVPQLKSLF
ncbi:Maff2 family mobile element protein [Enterococcus sp. AZ196]|uniref:Maff2 family mobile element protein n=1 Tax=Enterococcus sp. AZ196 TaxID=2774659 RepID=UPI003D2BE9A7